MNPNKKFTALSIVVLVTLVLSLAVPRSVLAEDQTPPPPDSSEAAPEDLPTDEPTTDEPLADDAPTDLIAVEDVSTEPPPDDETLNDEVSVEDAPADDGSPSVGEPAEAASTEVADTQPPDASAAVPVDAETGTPDPRADLADVLAQATETGVVMADEDGEPLEMGTLDAEETLLTGDPWFTRYDAGLGIDITIGYTTPSGSCAGVVDDCYHVLDPIQAALDNVAANGIPNGESYTDPALGTITIHPIHIGAGTYIGQWTIVTDDLALYGDPGNVAAPGAGPGAPILSGTSCDPETDDNGCTDPGERAAGAGLTLDATNVTLIGLILQNYEVAIDLIASGQASFTAENNTIRNNGIGVFNENSVPQVDLHYNIFEDNGYAVKNVISGGSQYVDARFNYWGCPEGPVVERNYITTEGAGKDKVEVQHQEYYQWAAGGPGAMLEGFDPDASDCEVLFGDKDVHWDHTKAGSWTPYKIILDPPAPLEGPYCGDGNVDVGEACEPPDSTIPGSNDYCNSACQIEAGPYCGDGVVNGAEACDASADPSGATFPYACIDCELVLQPYCGDGTIDPGEACDYNASPTGAPDHYVCLEDCTTQYVPYCGDGTIDPGEACDYNASPTGAPDHYVCLDDCTTQYVPYCGDGIVNGTEVCDESADPSGATFPYACIACELVLQPYCGDGIVNDTEVCDYSASPTGAPDHYVCLENCTTEYVPYCGDGIVNGAEVCDYSASPTGAPDHYVCLEDCTTEYVPYCGDGIIDPGEECDGSAPANYSCSRSCQLVCNDVAATNYGEVGICVYPPYLPAIGGFTPVGGASAIAAGLAHTCAITPQGGVQCWGNNDHGQLGDGTNASSNVPVDVVGLGGGSQIVAGANHTCLLAGSAVWCWGQNDEGQIGDATTTDRNIPTMVLTGASSITAGADYTCAVLWTGAVMCWGNNGSGQLADDTTTDHDSPTLASLITDVWGVDAGQGQTCGLTQASQITCWSGGLIPVTGGMAETHTQVSVSRFGATVVGVSPQRVPVVIDQDGATEISGASGVIDVDSGVGHVCALLSGGAVKCWGANSYGQLGNNTTAASEEPVYVANLSASLLAVGANHACAIVTATTQETIIKCWGLNSDGQLGDATNTNSPVAVEVKVQP
jgi:hypothetical protein